MPVEGLDVAATDDEGRVRALIDQWVQATLARDAAQYADLFLRDGEAWVAWASGDTSRGWNEVYDHALRELYHAKVHVQRVDVDPPHVVRLTDDALTAAFAYAIHYRDFWGTMHTTHRLATMTLIETKDGLRIASAHFSRHER